MVRAAGRREDGWLGWVGWVRSGGGKKKWADRGSREDGQGGWVGWRRVEKKFRSLAIIVFVRSAVIATRVLSIPPFSAG